MQKTIDINLSPIVATQEDLLKKNIASKLKIDLKEISGFDILRRSIDARKKDIKINLRINVFYNEKYKKKEPIIFEYQDVGNKPEVIIIGSGPAGLFAGLSLIEKGLKPIIIERGKPVSERKRDVASASKNEFLNPESNYCFGEGGAGTFSDGKLYTRSLKRGNTRRILESLVFHGASEEILIDAHPHIGTNKLPRVISAIRKTIENSGGKILFNTRVDDFIIENNQIKGVITQKDERILSDNVILATGHSASDIYYLLDKKKILLETKTFAVGVRVEHPQGLIDTIQYHNSPDMEYLPAASYKLVTQVENRGVYSFCMCPGGFIVPSATAQGEIVVNGMSPARRDSYFANSGFVVEVRPEDLPEQEKYGVLAGLKYRENIEKTAFLNGGDMLTAGGQTIADFVKGKISPYLPETSYNPGVISSPIHFWLPESIGKRLQSAFKVFDKKMHGFITSDALVVGVESRSSSPVRIPRDKNSLQHPQIKGLYPCGEGSGYAGGIISAAIDGQRCAEII